MLFCSVCQRQLLDIYCDKYNTFSESIILNNNLVDDFIYPEQTHPHFEQHHSHNSGCNQTSCSSSRAPGAPGRRWPAFTSLWLSLLMYFHPFHREKANLAVTLCNDKEEIMAHGIFLDYPNWNVAKQDNWVSVFEELDNEIPCTVRTTHSMFIGTTQLGGRAWCQTSIISVSGSRHPTLMHTIATS